jgi:hypothetical protein
MWGQVIASMWRATTNCEGEWNFRGRRQGQSESEISVSVGKVEKSDIIAVPPSKGQCPRRPIYEPCIVWQVAHERQEGQCA